MVALSRYYMRLQSYVIYVHHLLSRFYCKVPTGVWSKDVIAQLTTDMTPVWFSVLEILSNLFIVIYLKGWTARWGIFCLNLIILWRKDITDISDRYVHTFSTKVILICSIKCLQVRYSNMHLLFVQPSL